MVMWQYYARIIAIVVGILLPIVISILKNKKFIFSEPKKFLYLAPGYAFLITVGISVLVELLVFLAIILNGAPGEGVLLIVMWPPIALGYVFGVTLFVFLISLAVFCWHKLKR